MAAYTNDQDFMTGTANLAELLFGNPKKAQAQALARAQAEARYASAERDYAHADVYSEQANDLRNRQQALNPYITQGSADYDRTVAVPYGIGETNADRLGKYQQQQREMALSDAIIGGSKDRRTVAGAQAASAGDKQFDVQGDTLFDLFDGRQAPTAIGKAKIGTEGAKQRTERAQAGAYGAQANKENAHAALYRQQGSNLVPGADGMTPADVSSEKAKAAHSVAAEKFDAEYKLVKNPDGTTSFAKDVSKAAAKKYAPPTGKGGSGGSGGAAGPAKMADRKAATLMAQDALDRFEKVNETRIEEGLRRQMEAAIARQIVEEGKPESEAFQHAYNLLMNPVADDPIGGPPVNRRAAGAPGADFWKNGAPPEESFLARLFGGGTTTPTTTTTGTTTTTTPTTTTTTTARTAPATAAVPDSALANTVASIAPSQAQQAVVNGPPRHLLKEGVVTEFRNGQKWMLQGGQPVKVK